MSGFFENVLWVAFFFIPLGSLSLVKYPVLRENIESFPDNEPLNIEMATEESETQKSWNPPMPSHREMSTQTDYCPEASDEEPAILLFCVIQTSKNEVSTQTNIVISNRSKKGKVVLVEETPKRPCKSVAVGADYEMRNGFLWSDDIKDDTAMKQLAGITISFFNILLQFIKPNVRGQPGYFRILKPEDRLLLFLMKMKLGLNFTALACVFNLGQQTASDVFYSVLETKTWIFWPSKESVKETLPSTFKNYPNCRAIIDCTELYCETPPTVEMRALMYSTYKSHFTLKYLIAITPSGYISFVSKGYGGRTTDCIIVNDSGFLSLIKPGDQILADKGFPGIQQELSQRKCTLTMPPFATNPQFSREEVLRGYSIASVRIHVERSIQRIKIFKVLEHVNMKLVPHMDKIMYLACVFANNKEPLSRKN
jgi:hypothetical protein